MSSTSSNIYATSNGATPTASLKASSWKFFKTFIFHFPMFRRGSVTFNCRIHHVTASMTTIDLIIKPRTELLEPVTTLFKLAAPSISSCALSIYFSQFLPLLLFSSYPLPTLTMDHIPLSKCGHLWTFVYPTCMQNAMASEVLYGLIRPR